MKIFHMVFRIIIDFKYIQQRYYVLIYYVYKYHHHKTQWIKKKNRRVSVSWLKCLSIQRENHYFAENMRTVIDI